MNSYNGWEASRDAKSIDIDASFTAGGRKFPGGVKRGPVSVVFRYLVEQFDKRVEDLDLYDPGDEWGYYYKPSANSPKLISCHSSGTALDLNATRHPNGKRGTFTAAQVKAIRSILAELDGVVFWGGDFSGTPDEMHFEIRGTAADVARVAGRILQPIPDEPEEDDMPPAPATCFDTAGRRWVFVNSSGSLYGKREDEAGFRPYGGQLTSAPSAVLGPDGLLNVVTRGIDGASWLVKINADDFSKSGWKSLGGKS